uniref:Permease n=1 Tax=Desulfobacca acetoxidans TaxID=60893 RepID=A0A7V4GA53_9BACT
MQKKYTDWKQALRSGLLGGVITVLLSLIGIVTAFSNTYIINKIVNFGELLILGPIAALSLVAIRKATSKHPALLLLTGAISGLTSGLVVLALAGLGQVVNLRAMFLNASDDLYAIYAYKQALGPGLLLRLAVCGLVGIAMAIIFRKEEKAKVAAAMALPPPEAPRRPFWQTAVFFFSLVIFLIFAAWVTPREVTVHLKDGQKIQATVLEERSQDMIFQLNQDWEGKKKDDQLILPKEKLQRLEREPSLALTIAQVNFYIAGAILIFILLMLWRWFTRPEIDEWLHHTWEFTKLLAPLLYGGVLAVGFVSALIPPQYVASLVGDNSLFSNFSAALIGAFWYFATLTEVPITQALIKMGMDKGPALALLLAGPALSLPNMIVISRVMGWKKAMVFVTIIVIVATFVGLGFGWLVG